METTFQMELDFDRDSEINPDDLDIALLEQLALAKRYGKHYIALNKKLLRLTERKKTIRSELILEVNRDPKKCIGKDKLNAADIEAFYRAHNRYKEVIDELIEVQAEVDFAELAKNEICFTRKAVIEGLIKLHGQQWFAGPSIPKDLSATWRKRKEHDAVETRMSEKLNRKKGK